MKLTFFGVFLIIFSNFSLAQTYVDSGSDKGVWRSGKKYELFILDPNGSVKRRDTRLGMHACKRGVMLGIHVNKNRFLCSGGKDMRPSQSLELGDTLVNGNPFTGARIQGGFVDGRNMPKPYNSSGNFRNRHTAREGMHACPIGSVMVGTHVNKNLLLCSTKFAYLNYNTEYLESSYARNGMRACPEGYYMTGHHKNKNQVLCASKF